MERWRACWRCQTNFACCLLQFIHHSVQLVPFIILFSTHQKTSIFHEGQFPKFRKWTVWQGSRYFWKVHWFDRVMLLSSFQNFLIFLLRAVVILMAVHIESYEIQCFVLCIGFLFLLMCWSQSIKSVQDFTSLWTVVGMIWVSVWTGRLCGTALSFCWSFSLSWILLSYCVWVWDDCLSLMSNNRFGSRVIRWGYIETRSLCSVDLTIALTLSLSCYRKIISIRQSWNYFAVRWIKQLVSI